MDSRAGRTVRLGLGMFRDTWVVNPGFEANYWVFERVTVLPPPRPNNRRAGQTRRFRIFASRRAKAPSPIFRPPPTMRALFAPVQAAPCPIFLPRSYPHREPRHGHAVTRTHRYTEEDHEGAALVRPPGGPSQGYLSHRLPHARNESAGIYPISIEHCSIQKSNLKSIVLVK